MPMFVGGQNWLQVDVSHVPRPDQYAFMQYSGGSSSGGSSSGGASAASGSAANVATTGRDRVSETKTVYYFLAGGAGQALPPGLSAGAVGGGQQGLMRREADRAVTAWSSYGGGSSGVGPALEALAPEIASLSLSYFNGSSWSNSWDSRIYYCLPRAVEIRITLADELDKRDAAGLASAKRPAGQTRNQAPLKEYVLRVPIPAWRPPNLQLLNSMANSTASGAGSSGSSSSGGAGGMGSY
ncbi:MAG TPA: hypothetical protein VN699_00650 [Pirellulales bacterium]|nr:hypothetical protein [Pirellulales bacterium]